MVKHITGIVTEIDNHSISLIDLYINCKLFYSNGKKYKLKHNFTEQEIAQIKTGNYIKINLKSKGIVSFADISENKQSCIGHNRNNSL